MWIQKQFSLSAKSRGFHLITDEILTAVPELSSIDCGLLHLFIKHTSASLTINENAETRRYARIWKAISIGLCRKKHLTTNMITKVTTTCLHI